MTHPLIEQLERFESLSTDERRHVIEQATTMLRLLAIPPNPPSSTDGRARPFRVRLMLTNDEGDLVADTDSELPSSDPGATIVHGYPAIMQWAQAVAMQFHGARGDYMLWPAPDLVKQKFGGWRVAMSRQGGHANFQIPYAVNTGSWRAVVDVRREESDDDTATS